VLATPPPLFTAQPRRNRAMTPSALRHKFLAAEFDQKLAGVEPLLDVVEWYVKHYYSPANNTLRLDYGDWDCSANEIAVINFNFEDMDMRRCLCTRPDPNVCECWETLKATRAASAHAPIQEPVQEPVRGPDNDDEIIFQDHRYITLLLEAFNTHPDYAGGDPSPVIRRWQELGIATTESARLVDWFCVAHPMRMYRIERDLKIRMRKQGWQV
jgi:hypothetical protein